MLQVIFRMNKPSATALIALAGILVTGMPLSNSTPPAQSQENNAEIAQMFKEDQADRSGDLSATNWHEVAERDEKRRTRALELVKDGSLKTGTDFFHAAMIFQHSEEPDGYKMAHELSVIAVSLGHPTAKWLAAASWDRFLLSIEHKQRFGTQFWIKDKKASLQPVDEKITDSMRKFMNCPTLEQAKQRAVEMQKQIDGGGHSHLTN